MLRWDYAMCGFVQDETTEMEMQCDLGIERYMAGWKGISRTARTNRQENSERKRKVGNISVVLCSVSVVV